MPLPTIKPFFAFGSRAAKPIREVRLQQWVVHCIRRDTAIKTGVSLYQTFGFIQTLNHWCQKYFLEHSTVLHFYHKFPYVSVKMFWINIDLDFIKQGRSDQWKHDNSLCPLHRPLHAQCESSPWTLCSFELFHLVLTCDLDLLAWSENWASGPHLNVV